MRYYITILFTLATYSLSAQSLAVKTNLLYDATATINLGVEVALGGRSTIDISGNYNAWYTNEDANEKIRHFFVQPEYRYYFCEVFNGHFLGAHAIVGEYNVSGEQWLLDTFKDFSSMSSFKDDEASRYEGYGYGAGIVYGYDLMLSSRLNLEFTIGAGYIYFDYDRYGAGWCGTFREHTSQNYFGLTKLGISLVYLIK